MKINIVTFMDINMIDHLFVLLNSIEKIYSESDFHLYVGVDNEIFYSYSENFCEKNVTFVNIQDDVKSSFSKYEPLIPEEHSHITIFSMAILKIFDFFPGLISEKVLYVDADVFFNGKLKSDYLNSSDNIAFIHPGVVKYSKDENFKRMYKNKVSTSMYKSFIEKAANETLFNTGVIFINDPYKYIEVCREANKFEGSLPDGDLLNYFGEGKIIPVKDDSHNYMMNLENEYDNKLESKDISIFHFTGNPKPWKVEKSDDRYLDFKNIGYFDLKDE